MRSRRVLASFLLLGALLSSGCTPPQDIAYVEDENARLKQLLIQYENDARNNQVMMTESNGRVNRVNLELEAANRKIGVYESEIPRLRNLAVQAAQTAQASNQAQYAQYQQYVQYMNQMNRNRPVSTGSGTLRSDLAQQLSSLADQFGGVIVGNRLELPGDFFFDSGRYDLNPNARAAIRRMAEILAGENLPLMIVGHTDNDPIKNPALRSRGITDNLHLSLLRAKAVVDELKKAGYPANLMYPTGWGEMRPIVPNTDRASKKLNRRVDILIDPTSTQTMGMSEITGVEPVSSIQPLGTMSTAEPLATTYVQPQGVGQSLPMQPASPSYSTIETIEPIGATTTVTTYDSGTSGGTADIIVPSATFDSLPQAYNSAPVYSDPQVYSAPQVYTAQPTYPAPQPYAAPQPQMYPAPQMSQQYQMPPIQQPYGVPQMYGQPPMYSAPPMYGQPLAYADPRNPSASYTATLEPLGNWR